MYEQTNFKPIALNATPVNILKHIWLLRSKYSV